MDIILCLAGAFLSGLPYLADKLCFFLFFAPAFFFLSLLNEKRPFLKGVIFGAVFYAVNSFFLISLDVSFYAASPLMQRLLPVLGYIVVVLIESVFMGLFAHIFILIKKAVNKTFFPLVFSSLWIIYEFLIGLSFLDTGYTWGRISVPMAAFPHLIQTASLFGMLFISFIIIYFATSLAMSCREKSFKFIIFPLIILTLSTSFSLYIYSVPEKGESISVKCVQSGYGGRDKWNTSVTEIVEHTVSEMNGAELVVFSESAIPIYLNKSSYLNVLSSVAEENNVEVLSGSMYIDDEGNKFTSIYHFPYTEGAIYHKRHLVPFGEYYPIFNMFSKEARESGYQSGTKAITLSKYKVAPIICFDSIFPLYARESAFSGARLFAVSSNDSWFSKGNAQTLHLYHSVYRSIENSRYTVRSACTGISAIIDTKGNIRAHIPFNKSGSVTENVLLSDELTPYTIWGDLPMLSYAFIVIAVSVLREKRRRKNAG